MFNLSVRKGALQLVEYNEGHRYSHDSKHATWLFHCSTSSDTHTPYAMNIDHIGLQGLYASETLYKKNLHTIF